MLAGPGENLDPYSPLHSSPSRFIPLNIHLTTSVFSMNIQSLHTFHNNLLAEFVCLQLLSSHTSWTLRQSHLFPTWYRRSFGLQTLTSHCPALYSKILSERFTSSPPTHSVEPKCTQGAELRWCGFPSPSLETITMPPGKRGGEEEKSCFSSSTLHLARIHPHWK